MTMGRGADGGLSRDLQEQETLGDRGLLKAGTEMTLTINVFAQAFKALASKHPFDADETASEAAGTSSHSQVRTGDGRRRHRKVHGRGALHESTKIGTGYSKEAKSSKLWLEMEEYFRPVTIDDIMALQSKTQFSLSVIDEVSDGCLRIPGCGTRSSANCGGTKDNLNSPENTKPQDTIEEKPKLSGLQRKIEDVQLKISAPSLQRPLRTDVSVRTESRASNSSSDIMSPTNETDHQPGVRALDSCCQEREGAKQNITHNVSHKPSSLTTVTASAFAKEYISEPVFANPTISQEQDLIYQSNELPFISEERELVNQSNMSLSLLSTNERTSSLSLKRKLCSAKFQSKKQKVCGTFSDGFFIIVSPPEKDQQVLCHVCNGPACEEQNEVFFCHSCGVVVHKECYGIEKSTGGQWVCSWCSYFSRIDYVVSGSNDDVRSNSNKVIEKGRPCLLCPKGGGALKPVVDSTSKNGTARGLKFAHLFCCQWIPETYIENTDNMEPVKNVEGISEARWKLTCSLCRQNYGVCIECSHGVCSTAFHPLCAREMKLLMGIMSMDGSEDVFLWALCPKHSMAQQINSTTIRNYLVHNVLEASIQEPQMETTVEKKDSEKGIVDAGKVQLMEAQENNASVTYNNGAISTTNIGEAMDKSQGSVIDQTDEVGLSSHFMTSDFDDLAPETTFFKDSSVVYGLELEDIPAGIGDTAVDKHSNSKNDSLKLQDLKGFDNNGDEELQHDQADSTCISVEGQFAVKPSEFALKDSNTNAAALLLVKEINASLDYRLEELNTKCNAKPPETYVHPLVKRKLLQAESNSGDKANSNKANFNIYHGPVFWDTETSPKNFHKRQIDDARKEGVLQMAPNDELESEILFLQNALVDFAKANNHRSENLAVQVLKNLSKEQQDLQKQRGDLMAVNEYLTRAREAKKLGRKERKHKEAQAFLAAATAAVAASPRISSSRKDGILELSEEHNFRQMSIPSKLMPLEEWNTPKAGFSGMYSTSQPVKGSLQKRIKGNSNIGRPSTSSQSMIRTKDTFSRSVPLQVQLESHSEGQHLSSESLGDESVVCDICRQQESSCANKIIVCYNCNVAVHQDCYGFLKNSTGFWYCEPCNIICWQSQGITNMPRVSSCATPGCGVECVLCRGVAGAFKRTIKSQWVHVFCAEWILEHTYRRGQLEAIGGLETLPGERFTAICSVCGRRGVCLKCNYGHCQTSFHPICARDSGFYMNVSFHGSRIQHKAYCEKHSSEQKHKAELRRYGGPEELKLIKQTRVELERLRLICDRIVRREKLKREILHCNQDALALKRDCVAISAVFHSSFSPPDMSSHVDAAPAIMRSSDKSLKEYGPPRHERLDEHTVESTASGQLRETLPCQSEASHLSSTMDNATHGRTTVDSTAFVGESGRVRSILSHSADSTMLEESVTANKSQKRTKRRSEILQREIVMTPTEASMQNQRLPKGYAYVPVCYLSKGNVAPHDVKPQDT